MDAPSRPLLFVHVPKACGTTLIKLLGRWFSRDATYMIGLRPRDEVLRDLTERSASGRPPLDLIAGHAAFGLHEALDRPANYITVLRDPVERLLSHFHYARRNPRHHLHDKIAKGEIGIVELAARRANLQTRYLGGAIDLPPDNATLAQAKQNIEKHFLLAGVAERFDETVLLLHRVFGRRLLPFASENVGRNTDTLSSVDATTLRALRREHEIDYELYDFVRERFEAQLAASDSAKFRRSLAALRIWNRAATTGAAAWQSFTQNNFHLK
jgi:hypothetical protein